jgi:hypothetical protein
MRHKLPSRSHRRTRQEAPLSYEQALNEARRVGAGRCEGLALLALTCEALSRVHAIVPRLVFEGARKGGLDAEQVRRLDAVSLGDLMFV